MKHLRRLAHALDLAAGRALRWLLACLAPPDLYDLVALAGLLLLAVGLWLIYPPVAIIVTGAAFLTFGLWGAKTWTSESERKSLRRRRDRS